MWVGHYTYASFFWPAAAIIVVTMDESAEVIQQALASGADDFIRKPVNAIELVARLKIRIDRLKDRVPNTVFENGDLRLDVQHKMLKGNNGYVQLSQRETELLAHLIKSDGVIISRKFLKESCGVMLKLPIMLWIEKYLKFVKPLKLYLMIWFFSQYMDVVFSYVQRPIMKIEFFWMI